jgi:diketogulonate reductase-like aldo/keto reductase
LEAGALFIDTAESYGTEPVVGEAVRGLRDGVFIATKVSPEHFREHDFRKSVDASLLRLGIDSIDMVQLHSPNPCVPLQETMGALAGLVDAGKVRFCGVSNFSVRLLQQGQKALGKYPIVSNQVRYNLIDRTIEQDLLPYCQRNQITVIAYSPLAEGLQWIAECDPSGTVLEVARMLGKSPAQILINWCLCKDGVIAIPRANSEQRILENCGASGWRLTAAQVALLDARVQFHRLNRFETLAREWLPPPLKLFAKRALARLPRGVRRRVLHRG